MSTIKSCRLLAIWKEPGAYIFAGESKDKFIVWSGGRIDTYSSVEHALLSYKSDWTFYEDVSEIYRYGTEYRHAHDKPRSPDWTADDVSVEWNNETKQYDFFFGARENKIQSDCQCPSICLLGQGHLSGCPYAPKPKKYSYL